MTGHKKKLIEVALPLEAINQEGCELALVLLGELLDCLFFVGGPAEFGPYFARGNELRLGTQAHLPLPTNGVEDSTTLGTTSQDAQPALAPGAR